MSVITHESEAGIFFRCEYEELQDEVIFTDIRVLDANYRVQGPNLASVLGSLFYLRGRNVESFLSTIEKEIHE